MSHANKAHNRRRLMQQEAKRFAETRRRHGTPGRKSAQPIWDFLVGLESEPIRANIANGRDAVA